MRCTRGNGWYNDDKPGQSFDYYNSWVFASHFLYWNAMVGERFGDWSKVFGSRLRQYLDTAPLFLRLERFAYSVWPLADLSMGRADSAGSCICAATLAARSGNAPPDCQRQSGFPCPAGRL